MNGNTLRIGHNLHSALVTLRNHSVLRKRLWVDAVCINQKDVHERNKQVELMSCIYGQSQTTHIWLGQGDSSIYDCLRRLKAGIVFQDPTQLALGLQRLVDCQWFRRLWVVQEALLSKEPIVNYHDVSMNLWELWESLRNATHPLIHQPKLRSEASNSDFNYTRYLDTLSHIYYSFVRPKRNLNQGDIYDLLWSLRFCSVTDPRDRVFGVLGLISRQTGIKPNYAASLADTYEDAMVSLIEHSDSLELLRLLNNRGERLEGLPTWAVDWRRLGSGGQSRERDSAESCTRGGGRGY
jgi:hypothetical protein